MTIYDVAQLAGVKKSTVSNVINNKVMVKEETRERVLAAMAKLNYVPSPVARGLKKGKTYVLALMVPMVTNPFYSEVIEVVERVAEEHGYHLLLSVASKGEVNLLRTLQHLTSRSIDGLLLMVGRTPWDEIQKLRDRHIPVVVAAAGPVDGVPSIEFDNQAAGALAAQHLVDLGHQRMGVIVEMEWHGCRLKGFTDTLLNAGITLAPEYIQPSISTFPSGYTATQKLLALPEPPTAIFATNDLKALGAMQAVLDAGYSVPNDVSIIGVDNIAQGEYARPALTTISLPKNDFGVQAIELLLRCIEEPEKQDSTTVLLPPKLVLRESTGPCGRCRRVV